MLADKFPQTLQQNFKNEAQREQTQAIDPVTGRLHPDSKVAHDKEEAERDREEKAKAKSKEVLKKIGVSMGDRLIRANTKLLKIEDKSPSQFKKTTKFSQFLKKQQSVRNIRQA